MKVECDDSIRQEKGDIQNYNNYRGIKLLSPTTKVWEKVVKRRLRRGVFIMKNWFGFMLGNPPQIPSTL